MNKMIVAVLILSATPATAEVRLPKVIGSNMVLQRDAEVRIWGWADAGESIRVRVDWSDEKIETTADATGRWETKFTTAEAGGPHELTISGANRITLSNILFGEVWLASGQSNMEMPLVRVSGAYTGIQDAAQEVAAADHPQIRLFRAGNFSSKELAEDVAPGIEMYGVPLAECQWRACTPDTVPHFSSTAYFFARELQRRLDVPIGIIDASWGGTSAEVWTPAEGLKELGMTAELEQAAAKPQQADQKIPTRLYNGMIHPLRKLRIKGVIWYQGEGNSSRPERYRELFGTMIRRWRTAFGQELPFYFVQISPYQYRHNAAFLREAQLQTLALPKTGMAVTMDIGDLKDIHPKNKQEVGRRLALWALAQDYGRELPHSGPLYARSEFADGAARIDFDHAAGLTTTDGKAPSHLEAAGADRVFHPATAAIEGRTLVVRSDKVPAPKAVRYAFSSVAVPNLTNAAGLPASSFRTDDW